MIEVLRGLFQVAIQDNHVVTAGSHAWQNIEGAPGDEARAVRGQAGGGEVSARVSQEFGLGVNRRQDTIGGHAVKNPQARHTRTGTDLKDGTSAGHSGEHTQGRSRSGRDRSGAHFGSNSARGSQRVAFRHVVLGVYPRLGLVRHRRILTRV